MDLAKNFHPELKINTTWVQINGVPMTKTFFVIFFLLIISACSRPDTPPTTPVQPPTVEADSSKPDNTK